jgi:hypothetical protein
MPRISKVARPAVGVVDPSSPWFGNSTFRIRHDPAEAGRLLAESGSSLANPLRTRFIVPSGGSGQMLSMPMNEHIQSAWRQAAPAEIGRAGNITANNAAYLTSDPLRAFIRLFPLRADLTARRESWPLPRCGDGEPVERRHQQLRRDGTEPHHAARA